MRIGFTKAFDSPEHRFPSGSVSILSQITESGQGPFCANLFFCDFSHFLLALRVIFFLQLIQAKGEDKRANPHRTARFTVKTVVVRVRRNGGRAVCVGNDN